MHRTSLTVRTYIDPEGEDRTPAQNLELADLRWLVSEADRLGLPEETEISYEHPIVGGDPAGWGLTMIQEEV